ncbi:MAG: prephenate dehydrogenase/arogenate dehydrogenase family protein [Melioribacteraceae bacterium]|nr:prephenate dehydrogenase/arogenate dehydrogenase family protein [Melioribacteraceae bacterium]
MSIIGLGLIGGSIAKALNNSQTNFEIVAFDKPEILDKAITESVIDHKSSSVKESLSADVVFLCLPVELSLQYLKGLSPLLTEDQIISDVSGVKGIFEKKWTQLNSKGIYIGRHPMTGKEKGGYENSDPLLFENSVYILSDKEVNHPNLMNL